MRDEGKSPKEALAEHLKMSVLTLRLRPGEDLDEAQLSQAFGLSRTPLREVFRQLAGEGYLDLRTHRGARVSEMSHTTLRDFFLVAPAGQGVDGAGVRAAAQMPERQVRYFPLNDAREPAFLEDQSLQR